MTKTVWPSLYKPFSLTGSSLVGLLLLALILDHQIPPVTIVAVAQSPEHLALPASLLREEKLTIVKSSNFA